MFLHVSTKGNYTECGFVQGAGKKHIPFAFAIRKLSGTQLLGLPEVTAM